MKTLILIVTIALVGCDVEFYPPEGSAKNFKPKPTKPRPAPPKPHGKLPTRPIELIIRPKREYEQ